MLTAHNLSCLRNNQPLFSNLTIRVSSGEMLHITGPNGCGKSTLLSLLAGLLTPEHGEICWQGTPITRADLQYSAYLTYIGHKPGIKPSLSVQENLYIAAALTRTGAIKPDWQAILHRFGLFDLRNTMGHALSAGQKQRTALARFMVTTTPLWILDEPFTALDAQGIATLQELVLQHCSNGGIAVLTSHHGLGLSYPLLQQLPLCQYL